MAYEVLARKWRPHQFSEIVGQSHVLKALVNALENQRLHHAYLFTGTRGVGKTTVARIFAKCLNCETGITPNPCGECYACRAIDEGRFVDLLEVDAASRTKVEDTRELLDNVQYAPTQARFKVYLIDEVHMLSGHSFNALLKTLEEPPPHVKFLLATTDPQKLPVTVLSRCLQFNLKRMPETAIEAHLAQVLGKESISFEAPALRLLAHHADGSMRDALSLLDQGIAFGQGQVKLTEMAEMLGAVAHDAVIILLEQLAIADGKVLLSHVETIAGFSPDYDALLAELITQLHHLALLQISPDALDESIPERERIIALAGQFSPEKVQLFYQMALQGRKDLAYAATERMALEMTLLRMLAFGIDAAAPVAAQSAAKIPKAVPPPRASQSRTSNAATAAPARPMPSIANSAPATTVAEDKTRGDLDAETHNWQEIVQAMGLRAVAGMVAGNCVLESVDGEHILLRLDQTHENMLTDSIKQRIQEALSNYFAQSIQLRIAIGELNTESPFAATQRQRADRQQAAEKAIADDVVANRLQETFDATLLPGSIKPLD